MGIQQAMRNLIVVCTFLSGLAAAHFAPASAQERLGSAKRSNQAGALSHDYLMHKRYYGQEGTQDNNDRSRQPKAALRPPEEKNDAPLEAVPHLEPVVLLDI